MNHEQQTHAQLARLRFQKIELWILNWRLTAAAGLLVLAMAMPSLRTVPAYRSITLAAVAAIYAGIYYFLATRSRIARSFPIYWIDLAAMSALLLLSSGDRKWIFVIAMYSISCLLIRSTGGLVLTFVFASILSLAYLLANWLTGLTPSQVFTQPNDMGVFFLFFFYAAGFSAFSSVLRRLSALELETHLAELRKSYRRRLHDDLGNTLCGLHFKIQALINSPSPQFRESLVFFQSGYQRAANVLKNIVRGFQEHSDETLGHGLERLKERIERETGLNVEVAADAGALEFTPEARREIVAILYEAAMNAYKHSGAGSITVAVRRNRPRVLFSVSDDGRGLDPEVLEEKKKAGSKGVTGMSERAKLIAGRFEIVSQPGAGTTVTFSLTHSGRLASDKLWSRSHSARLYSSTVFLKPVAAALIVFQVLITPVADFGNGVAMLSVMALLVANSLAWLVFRRQIHAWMNRSIYPFMLEFMWMGAIMTITMVFTLPTYITAYPFVSFIVTGILAGSRINRPFVGIFVMGILPAYLFPFASARPRPFSLRMEDYLTFLVGLVFCAFVVGIAGDYIRKLEQEQELAIGRAIEQKHEEISAETHKHLWSKVEELGENVRHLVGRISPPGRNDIRDLEARSRTLKYELRSILNSLDED